MSKCNISNCNELGFKEYDSFCQNHTASDYIKDLSAQLKASEADKKNLSIWLDEVLSKAKDTEDFNDYYHAFSLVKDQLNQGNQNG